MPLQSGSLQTTATDYFPPGPNPVLWGQVMGMDVLDPTEGDEKTSLLEVGDEFDVLLTWQLQGAATTTTGGYWIVSLYSDHMDGAGAMVGLLGTSLPIPLNLIPGPATYQYRFKVVPPVPQVGLYKLTATISHSTTGSAALLTEMFGYAEATPITIRQTVVETADS